MAARYEPDEGCLAVVGMACRVPGADDLDAFWDNLMAGRTSMETIPDEELAAGPHAALRHDPDYVPVRSTLRDYDMFDAGFFGISAREAGIMDPQHRLALEYAWRAFENAGHVPQDTDGIRTGVFGSSDMSSYLTFNLSAHLMRGHIDVTEAVMGNDKDFLATRIAYRNDFKGPAYTVQSACSSSLVSIHAACQALLAEECDRALVVSATVMLPGNVGCVHIPGGMRSPDGMCRPFDARADGTIFANGVVAVLLKRFNDAVRDRDHIWAVVRATAVNNDGASKVGFSAPSVDGQADVIRTALSAGGIQPIDVAYIEGHGTGTPMGDPVEVAALMAGYGLREAPSGTRVVLGSVKGNIGHMDATAGIGSFVKACLALHHGTVPGTAHFNSPNPGFGGMAPLVSSASPLSLERHGDTPLLAGVSAFGFGGTNVHVILQEAPPTPERVDDTRPQLLLLSAPDSDALHAMRGELRNRLAHSPHTPLRDVGYTLSCGRRHFAMRHTLIAHDVVEATRLLDGEAEIRKVADGERPVAFLFPGQGNLHAMAGVHFLLHDELFGRELAHIAKVIHDEGGPDIIDTLGRCRNDTRLARELLGRTDIAQPVLFGLEYAFASTLMHRGIRPACMVGHSLGEYAAATVAGVFAPEDGARLVVRRGRLMQGAPGGRMLVAPVEAARLHEVLGDAFDRVELSVINSPCNSVLSGKEEHLDTCAAILESRGLRGIMLNTSHGFHSSAMDCIMEPFRRELERIELSAPRIPFVTNLTGGWAGDDVASPDYWVRHLRNPVQFVRCLATLKTRAGIGVEVGPGNVMRALAMQQGDAEGIRVVGGLDPVQPPAKGTTVRRCCLDVASEVWLHGGIVDWEAFHSGSDVRRCPLPGVVLHPKRHWIEPELESLPEKQVARGIPPSGGHERTCQAGYVPPATDIEHKLVEIWRKLLFLDTVGTRDDFLELGGNSIQVMQMIRSAVAEGMRFSARDVFEGRNIEGLAKRVKLVEPTVDLGPGPVPAPPYTAGWDMSTRPAARWLFAVVSCPPAFGRDDAGRLAIALAQRHDALRIVYRAGRMELLANNARNWAVDHVEDIPGLKEPHTSTDDVVQGLPDALLGNLTPNAPEADAFSALLSGAYADGERLWRLILIPQPSPQTSGIASPPRLTLLLIVSRLVADEPSVGLLIRDISDFMCHGKLAAPPSCSWKQWATLLTGERFTAEANCIAGQWPPLPSPSAARCTAPYTGAPTGTVQPADTVYSTSVARYKQYAFPAHGLRDLLYRAAAGCRAPVDALVTAAAAHAALATCAGTKVLHCYGTGRERLFPQVAPDKTVGAFSYRYPLPLPHVSGAVEDMVPWLKTLLDAMPAHGKAAWTGDRQPPPVEVVFNGLGVTALQGLSDKGEPSEHMGEWSPPSARPEAKREVTAFLSGDRLCVSVRLSPDVAQPAWGREFSRAFTRALRAIAEDGAGGGTSCRHVPADFPDSGLTSDDIERILEQLAAA